MKFDRLYKLGDFVGVEGSSFREGNKMPFGKRLLCLWLIFPMLCVALWPELAFGDHSDNAESHNFHLFTQQCVYIQTSLPPWFHPHCYISWTSQNVGKFLHSGNTQIFKFSISELWQCIRLTCGPIHAWIRASGDRAWLSAIYKISPSDFTQPIWETLFYVVNSVPEIKWRVWAELE